MLVTVPTSCTISGISAGRGRGPRPPSAGGRASARRRPEPSRGGPSRRRPPLRPPPAASSRTTGRRRGRRARPASPRRRPPGRTATTKAGVAAMADRPGPAAAVHLPPSSWCAPAACPTAAAHRSLEHLSVLMPVRVDRSACGPSDVAISPGGAYLAARIGPHARTGEKRFRPGQLRSWQQAEVSSEPRKKTGEKSNRQHRLRSRGLIPASVLPSPPDGENQGVD